MERSLVRSRSEASSLISTGAVTVDGRVAVKPAHKVRPSTEISIAEVPRWVSRGALKLLAALEHFDIDCSQRAAIDVGSSTGGFTEVLLAKGVSHVVAIDVGRGQLAQRLLADDRVTSLEGTDIRSLEATTVPGGPAGIVTVDVSFISLTKVAAALSSLVLPNGDLVALIKPQFEVGRSAIGKGGVVRDELGRLHALDSVAAAFEGSGLAVQATMTSPIKGGDGNVEFLLWAKPVLDDVETEEAG